MNKDLMISADFDIPHTVKTNIEQIWDAIKIVFNNSITQEVKINLWQKESAQIGSCENNNINIFIKGYSKSYLYWVVSHEFVHLYYGQGLKIKKESDLWIMEGCASFIADYIVISYGFSEPDHVKDCLKKNLYSILNNYSRKKKEQHYLLQSHAGRHLFHVYNVFFKLKKNCYISYLREFFNTVYPGRVGSSLFFSYFPKNVKFRSLLMFLLILPLKQGWLKKIILIRLLKGAQYTASVDMMKLQTIG